MPNIQIPKDPISLIRQDPDPILRSKSKIITDFSKDAQIYLNDIAKVLTQLSQLEKEGVRTVGMSAVQIGIPLRIATCLNPATSKIHTIINPIITSRCQKLSGYWEACASVGVGDDQIFAKVYRPERVSVDYLGITGKKMKKKASGFFSHVIQHEIDHMNGILFIDHVLPKNCWKLSDLNAYLKENHKYPPA
jgi:peptide deformylase